MIDILTVLFYIVIIGLGYYFYYKNTNVFKRLGIPYDPPKPIFGSMGPSIFGKMNFADLLLNLYNKHFDAKYFGIYDFQTPIFIIRDPNIIKSITIKNFDKFLNHRGFSDEKADPFFSKTLFSLKDDDWREMRSVLSPSFTSSKMKMMFNLMMQCGVNFTDTLLEQSKGQNYVVDVKEIFSRLSADFIFNCAFGISTNSMKDPKNKLYVISRKATDFEGILSMKFFLIRNFKTISRLLGVKIFNVSTSRFLTDVVSSNIETRRAKGITQPDYLQVIMEFMNKNSANRKVTMDEIVSNLSVFLFGGLDTFSTVLSYAAHEIAVNPEVQKRLQEEIDIILEDCNGKPTYNEINNMSYLEAVCNETLRLYPPVGFVDRICNESFELPPCLPGQNCVSLTPGTTVLIPLIALQRDPNYFENPDTFHPERFLRENKVNMDVATYLPFGIGPRICIGSRFALLEMKTALFSLLSRFHLNTCIKTSLPIQFKKSSFLLLSEGGYWLEIVERKGKFYFDK